MKPRLLSIARLSFPLATAIAALLAVPSLRAATYYWDNNGTTAGFGAAAGTWAAPTVGSATLGWSTSTTGVLLPGTVTTATADILNFGNGATGLAAGTITAGTVAAGNIIFASGSGAIVLTGGTITLAAAETITVNNAADTINSTLAGAATGLTKDGTGNLTLGGVIGTTAGTLNVNAGTLIVGNTANTFTGNVTITGATALLQMNGATRNATSGPLGIKTGSYKTVTLTNGGTFRPNTNFNDDTPSAASPGNGYVFSIGTGGGTFDVPTGVTFTLDDGTGSGTAWTNTQLQGTGTLTKTGVGTLSLGNAATSNAVFTGQILVNAGILKLGSVTAAGVALGATSAGTVIASGAGFDIGANLGTAAEPLNINGAGVAGTGNVIFTSATAATPIFAGPVTLAGNSTIGSTTAGTMTFTAGATFALGSNTLTIRNTSTGRVFTDGVISGVGGSVVMNSPNTGDYVPRADHTYTGGTTLTAGYIAVDRDSIGTPGSPTSGAFGTGTLTIAGGQIRSGTTANRTIGNAVALTGDATFYTAGGERTLTFTGPVTLSGGNRTLTANVGSTVAGVATVISGAIGDGGNALGLIKAGAGNLTLGGANTYTGATSVNSGRLNLTGSLDPASALSISPTDLGGATFTLGSGAANPVLSTAALTLGSATGSTTLGFDLGANPAGSDSINTTAAATTTGTVNIGVLPLAGFGSLSTYDLVTAASGLGGATYTLANAPGGFTYSLTKSATAVQLGVTPTPAGDLYWRGNTSNSWSALNGSSTNWYSEAAGTTNAQASPGAGDTVNFSTVNATISGGIITTTLDNNYTVNDLVFGGDPNGVTSVTIAAGTTPAGVPGVLAIAPSVSTDGVNVGSNAGSVTISASVLLGAAQTWSANGTGVNGSTLTVTGAITGTNTLNISGLVTLSSAGGSSTYSGATTVPDGGILQGGVANSFSTSSAVTVNGTGIVRINGLNNAIGSLAGTGIVENNHASTGVTLTAGADGTDTTFSGILRNGAAANLGFTKTGAGKLTLSGNNIHTGATTVNAGSLLMGSSTALTSANGVTLSGTGTLDLNGYSVSIGGLTSSVAACQITNSSASTGASTATALNTPAGAGVYVDALTSTSGGTIAAEIKDGPTRKTQLVFSNGNGSAQLSNGANSFSGGIVLLDNAAGTRMAINTAIGGVNQYGTGPIIIGQAPTDKAGIYFSGVANNTLSNPIIFNTALGTDRVGIRTDAAGIVLSGVITANLAPATFTANTGTAGTFTLTNQVTGASGLVLDITSLSASASQFLVTLNNAAANNNYQGDTVINFNAASGKSATLQLLAADQIPNGPGTGNVIINSNGTGIGLLSLAGGNETINGLSGSGNVVSPSGTVTLTLGDNNATASHSGSINNTVGTLSVTKIGAGTQTLSGTSNFGGTLAVSGGLVAFPSSPATNGPLGNSTLVNLNGGGISYTSAGANVLNRTVAIGASAGSLDVANATGTLTVATLTSSGGNLIKTGPGTVVISLNSGLGGVAVNDGTLQAGFGTGGVAAVAVGATGNLDQRNTAVEALTLGNSVGALTLSGGAQVGFELSGATNDSIAVGASGTAVTGGTVTLNFYGTPTAGVYNLLTAPSGLSGATYALGAAPNGFSYTINATDSLVSVTVSASIPIFWRGGQDLSWSTLGSGSANWTTDAGGAIDATSIPVGTDTVFFSATGAPTSPLNVISTTLGAAFTVDSLQFTNSPTGITDVMIAAGGGSLTLTPASTSGGIRVLASGGNATISAPLTTGAGQTWDVDPTGSLTVSGNTTFTGAVNKTNTGPLTLSGTNSGAGAITLTAGTLNINSATALGNGIFTVGAGTTINTPSGAIALSNNNVQNWNGDYTFTGANDLNLGFGTVTLGNSLIVSTAANTLTVGGIIGDGGNNRGLMKAGAGTLVLNGANTYTGPTAIANGILRITNATALGTAAGGVSQSGTSALELDGNGGDFIVGAEALTINGGGITDTGALRNKAGDNTYGGTITLAAQSRINSDSGTTLTLNNATAVSATGLTLVVGGAGNTTISGAVAVGTGGLAKDGTGILTLAGANTYVGNTTVANGTLNMTGSLTGNGTPTAGSNLLYGTAAGNSVVNVNGNIVNYLRFQGATDAAANAAYIQTAGTVNFTSTQTGDPTHAVATAGYGYLEITGGSLKANGRFAPSNGAATTGVMYLGGTGVLDNTGGEWFLMSYAPSGIGGGRSMLTVDTGGTLNRVGSSNNFGLNMDRSNGYAVLNIVGGSVLNSNRAITFGNGTTANITGTSGFLNLAAGVLQIGTNMLNGTTGAGSTGNSAYLNFAGGTLKAQAALSSAIPVTAANQTFTSTLYGAIDNAGISHDFAGGLTVDTNTFATTLANNLVAPSTDGVAQSSLTITGGSGYIGAPMVQFTGGTLAAGGAPAAGYAVISGGAVTEVVITAPGSYTAAPAVTLTGGGGTGASVAVGALVANTGGGLTKQGLGTLTLTGANTYTGATLVSGGTLQLNGTAATSPTTSAVTVSTGGTLGFTAASATTLDLSTKELTLSGGTLAFDISDPGINDAITVDDFTLTANSAFSFTGIGAIGGSYTLVTSANQITNIGFHTISGQTIGRVTLTPTIHANTITIGSSVFEGKWNQLGGGNWSLGDPGMTQDNWLNYKPTVPGDAALFGDSITASSVVAVDTPHIVGYLRFDNANAYTIGANGSSNLTLNNGSSNAVTTVTSGSHTIAENVALLSHLDVIPAASTTLTMSGVVSGTSRNLDMNGPGALVLSGVNTYSGTTTVSNGALTLSGNRTATMGAVTVGNLLATTATLNLSNGTFTTGQFAVGSGDNPLTAGIVYQTGGSVTLSGNQLLLGNNGTGTTAGSNSTGTYNLSGGTLNTVAGSLGVLVGTNAGTTGNFHLSGTGILSMPPTSTMQIARSDNAAANNSAGVFTQTGGTATVGILQMSGTAAAAVNGAGGNSTLSLTGGTFAATTFNALSGGNNSSSTITIGGTAQVTLPVFPTNAKGTSSTATITFDSTTGFLSPVAASATYMPAGTFTNAYLTANGAKFNVPSGRDITVAQVLADAVSPAAAGTLTKDGLGILTLSGANLFTGLTSVNLGSVNLGHVDALGTTAAGTTVASGARVTFGALTTAATVAESFSIAGTGIVADGVLNVGGNKTINLSGAITLTAGALIKTDGGAAFNFTNTASGIGGTDTSLTFQTDGSVASSIAGPISLGTGGLIKTGGSTLTLSGENTYSGGTTISGGIINATTSDNALGSGTVAINGGVRLVVATGLNVANAITIGTSPGAVGRGVLEAAGSPGTTATVSGPITITVGPSAGGHFLAPTGTTLHLAGVITSSVNVSQRDGTLMLSGGGTGYTALTTTGTTIVGATNGIATTALVTLGGSGNATLDLNGKDQSLAGISRNANTVTIGNSSTATDSTLTTTGTSSYAGTIVDIIGLGDQKVALAVNGGALTLTGTNTYSGGTAIMAGSLSLDAGADRLLNTGSVVLGDAATTGKLILGGTTAANQTLAGLTTTGLGGSVVGGNASNSTLTLNIASANTFSGTLGGAGTNENMLALTKTGSGTLTLTGTNTYTGATAVTAGTLALVGGSQASPVTVSNLASLGFTLGSPTTTTSTVTFDAGATVKITGTPTAVSYTLITSSTGITGTPVLAAPISGYHLKIDGNSLILENSYMIWASGSFTNPFTETGLTQNPDGDTLNNLQEFAFGTDPTVAYSGPIIYVPGGDVTTPGSPVAVNFAVGEGVDFRAVFGRRKDYVAAGLTYTVQFSAGLDLWVNSTDTPTLLTGATSTGDVDAVSVPYPLFITTPRGAEKPTFFRIFVSSN